jgi:hypothetical protein
MTNQWKMLAPSFPDASGLYRYQNLVVVASVLFTGRYELHGVDSNQVCDESIE